MKNLWVDASVRKIMLQVLVIGLLFIVGCSPVVNRDFYQIKIYYIEDEQQEDRMEQYLEKAFLPALHRAGIPHIGVFKPVEEDENHGKMILVLIPLRSLDELVRIPNELADDTQYQEDGLDYINASHDNAPYRRIENILLRSFKGMPEYHVPDHQTPYSDQVYELRSYEGATEKYYETKVEMFNDEGEVDLFIELGFQPVFFGEVISGGAMPNLMYMTTFSDTASQEERWDTFRNSAEWNRMKVMEKYQNTVSHMDRMLLHPTKYSDL